MHAQHPLHLKLAQVQELEAIATLIIWALTYHSIDCHTDEGISPLGLS
jgi:hypothetical protein